MKHYCSIPTPLGDMTALAEGDSLIGLWFTGQKHAPVFVEALRHTPDITLFAELLRQLDAYFRGRLLAFNLPLTLRGTPFRLDVWNLLRTIPFGATTTYGAVAKQLAMQSEGRLPAAQAVGGAVGHNPLAIVIPCHRVVGSNGALIGYAGGLERKAALLALEKVNPTL